jgi:radical SAM enzyme (TIGR01210 family)
MMMSYATLIEKSIEINKFLRKYYTETFCKDVVLPCKPFGGSPRESIGPWPEIIYRGFKCPRNEFGLCSPCGYSNVEKVPQNRAVLNKLLLFQTKFILDFFDEIIIQNQRREHPYPAFNKKYPHGIEVMMALTTIGSFFNEYELDEKTRIKILIAISSHVEKRKINIQIFLESHALDVINFYEQHKFDNILPILKELNAVIILGLESIDEFNRNVLYCKNLHINDFEKAINIIKNKLKLPAGAFIFVGLHSLNEKETLLDVKKTLSYLKEKEVMPVIMISNLKPYTMTHLLYKYGRYNLPDPRTILSVVNLLKDYTHKMRITEDWLFADPTGGPPEPIVHVFNNPRKVTCKKCSGIIQKAIFGDYNIKKPNALRETYNWISFEKKIEPVEECSCKIKYEEYLDSLKDSELSVLEKTEKNLNFARNMMERCCNEEREQFQK